MKEIESIGSSKSDSATALTFVLLLIAADCAFIFLHILLRTQVLDAPLLSLEKDRGYSEVYQYIKEFWIVLLLMMLLIKNRVIGYGVWAVLFAYVLFDDALSIHETLGAYVSQKLDIDAAFGLRAKDFGELIVSAIAAVILLSPLILLYRHGAPAFRQASRHLLMLLLSLAFFGIFVDMLHVIFRGGRLDGVFVMLEEGGEMAVMSLIVGYTFLLNMTTTRSNGFPIGN